ncbi:DUF961 domain-containing protein [Enterococcus faecalis]|uniref:YdcP family protein n=1 Tax=Enterococcus TaxID=1350 RepID=UPI001925BD7A|nr:MULTISPECIES: YdcP family protein [Enterococcus]MBO1126458.1 DUF961 domain-containing protein [Enterococcus faecalis]
MELKFVVPNMEKTFGHLTYAGEGEVLTEGSGRNRVVIGRSYHLYSDIQRADDIEIIVAPEAGEKIFKDGELVKVVNPKIQVEGYQIDNRGYTNYLLTVDDLVKVNGGM